MSAYHLDRLEGGLVFREGLRDCVHRRVASKIFLLFSSPEDKINGVVEIMDFHHYFDLKLMGN